MEPQSLNQQTATKKQAWYWILLVLGVAIGALFLYFQTKIDLTDSDTDDKQIITTTGDLQATGLNTPIDITTISFKATGTEPFWSLSFGSGNGTYSSPDILLGELYTGFTITNQSGTSYTLQNPQNMIIVISSNTITEKCSDGMSDTEYDGYITLTLPNAVVLDNGCIQTTLFDE